MANEENTVFTATSKENNTTGNDASQIIEVAIQHHQNGQLEQAEKLYRQVLQINPDHVDACHLLGIVLAQKGKNEAAVECLQKSLRLNPEFAEAHSNLGNTFRAMGQYDNAIASFEKAILFKPDYAEAYNNLGCTQKDLNQIEKAISSFEKATSIKTDYAEAHNNLGNLFRESGKQEAARESFKKAILIKPNFAEAYHNLGCAIGSSNLDVAIGCFKNAVTIKPDYAEAYNNLGNAFRSAGQCEDAKACYSKALSIKPDYAEAHDNLGGLLKETGQLAEAIVCYRKAIEIAPDFIAAYYNLGNAFEEDKQLDMAIDSYSKALLIQPNHAEVYHKLGNIFINKRQYDDAIDNYDKALSINPNYAAVYNNLGYALSKKTGDLNKAIEYYNKALSINPEHADTYNNLGCAYNDLGMFKEAEQAFRQALKIRPDFADAQFNWSLGMLLNGNFEAGWKKYRYRFKRKNATASYPDISIPEWRGECLQNKTLLIWAEQGLGDTIQFVRYLKKIKKGGARILFYCKPSLKRLLEPVSAIDQVIDNFETVAADFHIPLLNLPELEGTKLDTVPCEVPYLFPENNSVKQWREKLQNSDKLRVGLVWAGSPSHSNDQFRSVKLAEFSDLFLIKGISFYSMQKGEATGQLNDLINRSTVKMNIINVSEQLNDLSDTAALMANLDLVISVDTCVAHLAGALARPVWTLLPANPDWRWLLERNDSPWYPTMQLYRQEEPGNWKAVINRIEADLKKLAKNST